VGRGPATDETIRIPASRRLIFRPGTELKAAAEGRAPRRAAYGFSAAGRRREGHKSASSAPATG
jgi:hypothetical protein